MIDDKSKIKWTENHDSKSDFFLRNKNNLCNFWIEDGKTYAGINGGGNCPPGRPCGCPGPGRFGIAGAARFVAGGGGGPRPAPYKQTETRNEIPWQFDSKREKFASNSEAVLTVVIGEALRGPPGLGGDNFGLSNALDSQSFFTGGGTGVPTVAIDTSPILELCVCEIDFHPDFFWIYIEKQILPMIRSASEQAWYILNMPSRFCASSGLSSIIFDCMTNKMA